MRVVLSINFRSLQEVQLLVYKEMSRGEMMRPYGNLVLLVWKFTALKTASYAAS